MRIQSGDFIFSKDAYSELLDNDPPRPRTVRKFIKFKSPFAAPPTVVTSLAFLDVLNSANTRIDVTTDTIIDDGFELLAKTWWDTQIFAVGVSWIAYGD